MQYTFFKKILTSNSQNSSIFLRGIHHEELESILQFIYLGEATFFHERTNEFLNVAKNLDIKEICNNVVNEEEEIENVNDKQTKDNLLQSDENHISDRPILERTAKSFSSSIYDLEKPYKCQQCDYQALQKVNLNVHVQAKHEGLKYNCQHCDYKATYTPHLKRHMESKHKGIKYPCQLCDYQATRLSSLERHYQAKH